MDNGHSLTLAQAAAQLGVSEKTLRRRLQRPGHGGLDAVQLHTPQGYTWRLRLVNGDQPAPASGLGSDHPTAGLVHVDNGGPPAQPADVDRALSTLRDIVVEQQRRLEAYAEERGRLRALLAAYEQTPARPPAAPQRPRQRLWGRLWRGGGSVL